jgi:hypothetical protein
MGDSAKKPGDGISRRELITGAAAGAALLASRGALAAGKPQRIFRIHPAINVARAGNAPPDTHYVGPEVPGQGPVELTGAPVTRFKSRGQVRPQAARFRVYEYADFGSGLVPFQEVTLQTAGIKDIVWNVHLANRKSSFHRFAGPAGEEYDPLDGRTAIPSSTLRNPDVTDRSSLETDFGPRTLSAAGYASGRQDAQTFDSSSVPSSYAATWPVDQKTNAPVIPFLGQLRADAQGRLLVIGGKGAAGYTALTQTDLPSYANSPGWFDDVGDGPVTASVVLQDGSSVATDRATGSAWVLGAPPRYAPRLHAAVTLYDLLLDMAVRKLPVPANNGLFAAGGPLSRVAALKADYTPGGQSEFPTTVPYFMDDILPILDRAYQYRWTTGLVDAKHDSMNVMLAENATLMDPGPAGAKDRSGVFIYLRPPNGAGLTTTSLSGNSSMPHMQGDDPYNPKEPPAVVKQALTHLQFGMMQQWARPQNGFDPGAAPGPANTALSQLAFFVHGLDRAALEHCAGASFYPGIESSWQIRNRRLFSEPFRLNLNATSRYLDQNGVPEGTPIRAGHFSRQMAVPWHADFNDCRSEGSYGWWPSQRPTEVFADTSTQNLNARVDWTRPSPGLHYRNAQGYSTHEEMLQYWASFGFIVEQSGMFAEQERNPGIGS